MTIPEFSLKWGKEKRLTQGSLWAFRNEIDFKQKDAGPGALVRLKTQKGRPVGVGFLNTESNLCFRLLARHGEFPLEASAEQILETRLAQALDVRGPREAGGARRLVFSEGDWLPGLIVDDFNGVLVLQLNTAGMEGHRKFLLEKLKGMAQAKAMVERSDASFRAKEGLSPAFGLLWTQALDEDFLRAVPFQEDGLKLVADTLEGHKTGFFLDQRPARSLARRHAQGRRCLDVFCYSGGFSVAMALGGAKSVLGLDQSAPALEQAQSLLRLNKTEQPCTFEKADAFIRLRELEAAGEHFDLIVLDPPALAKDGEAVGGALRGYKELNLRALRLLNKGGLLLSCSCTQAVSEAQFEATVQAAAFDAPATLRELERLGAGPDHPRLPGMPETRYLKAFLYRRD